MFQEGRGDNLCREGINRMKENRNRERYRERNRNRKERINILFHKQNGIIVVPGNNKLSTENSP